jgi:MEKHLA domain
MALTGFKTMGNDLSMNSVPPLDFIVPHSLCLARSFKKWTCHDLLPGDHSPAELAEKILNAPFVVVSHGTQADPILNYGNRAALKLWEISWEEFTRTPSRLTAEAPRREERARLLDIVTRQGFIEDYSGIRISKSGRRFEISRATVWNLVSKAGEPCGQAATFSEWKYL